MFLIIGVISLIGALGAPDLASAAPGHSAASHSRVGHAAASPVKDSRGVATVRALRPSLFDAGHLQSANRSFRASNRSSEVGRDVKPADVPTLYVDATGGVDQGSCRIHAHPCKTIAYAITVSPPSANIDVANGTYTQQLVDSASLDLNIVGASESGTIIEPSSVPVSDPDTDSSNLQYPIVDAQPGSTVDLSNMTINGKNAKSQFTGCGPDYVGVYYHDANGSMSDVTVENVELSQSDFGCQDGLAIYAAADAGDTTSVTMSSVTVSTYDKNGITCDDAGTTCTISGSTVTGIGCTALIGQNGIQGDEANSITLSDDNVTGNCYSGSGYVATGLLLYDNAVTSATSVTADSDDVGIYAGNDGSGPATTTITISSCVASNATFANGLGGVGIAVDSATAGSVEHSTMKNDPGDGLALYGSSNLTIESNKAKGDYDGFYIGGPGSVGNDSDGNTVSSNKTSHNTQDGMYVDTDTSGNTFTSNIAKVDADYDYQDFSTGSGTAGTANTWTSDVCHPAADSTPTGLC
jgi:parallel beta-helix repeat protein